MDRDGYDPEYTRAWLLRAQMGSTSRARVKEVERCFMLFLGLLLQFLLGWLSVADT